MPHPQGDTGQRHIIYICSATGGRSRRCRRRRRPQHPLANADAAPAPPRRALRSRLLLLVSLLVLLGVGPGGFVRRLMRRGGEKCVQNRDHGDSEAAYFFLAGSVNHDTYDLTSNIICWSGTRSLARTISSIMTYDFANHECCDPTYGIVGGMNPTKGLRWVCSVQLQVEFRLENSIFSQSGGSR